VKSRDDRRDDRISGPKALAGSAARRVEAIIEGAEKAAERVIDEAEAKAGEYLAEAEAAADRTVAERLAALGELTDALVAQADAIRRQSELLTSSLREAKERLEAEGGAAPSPPASEPVPAPTEPTATSAEDAAAGNGESELDRAEEARTPHLAAVEPSETEEPGAPGEIPVDQVGERRSRGTPAGARLLATQMAVSGSSREEIAARLRTGFEIDDSDAILDAILGPEA
jgi:vacuolar-type H+-ATPase subunit H